MGKQRKTWSPEFREEIFLAVLSGKKSIAELASAWNGAPERLSYHR